MHWNFLRLAVSHPFRPCFIDTTNAANPVMKYGMALAGAKILARHLRPVLKDDAMVGLWLPPSVGGALANIAVAFLGKTAVNLNYSSTQDIVQSSIRQCGIKHVLTSRLFLHKVPLDPGPGVELVYLEDFRKQISQWERLRTFLGVLLVPGFIQEWLMKRQSDKPKADPANDVATIIFSSGSTGEPKGVMLTHANIAANVESMIQAIDIKPPDRLMGILPFFHSFGYSVTLVGAAASRSFDGVLPQSAASPRNRRSVPEIPGHDLPFDADFPAFSISGAASRTISAASAS